MDQLLIEQERKKIHPEARPTGLPDKPEIKLIYLDDELIEYETQQNQCWPVYRKNKKTGNQFS
jgi:hypothetical protein